MRWSCYYGTQTQGIGRKSLQLHFVSTTVGRRRSSPSDRAARWERGRRRVVKMGDAFLCRRVQRRHIAAYDQWDPHLRAISRRWCNIPHIIISNKQFLNNKMDITYKIQVMLFYFYTIIRVVPVRCNGFYISHGRLLIMMNT